MIINYNSLARGRDTWSKNDVGDSGGSPPVEPTSSSRSWWLAFMFFTLSFLTGGAFAQGTIQIGSGTSTTTQMPIYSCYGYNYTQQIVPASAYSAGNGVAGPITKIRFYYDTGGTTTTNWNDWTIYIGQTNKSSFSSVSDWIPVSELTQVYTGPFTATSGTWLEFTLSSPFVYDGTSNIVVAVDENVPGYSCTAAFRSYASTANSCIYQYDDTLNADPASPPDADGRTGTAAQIQFVGTLASCLVPNALATNFTSPSNVNFTWSAPSPAPDSYEYEISTSATPPVSGTYTTGTTASATGLAAGGNYYGHVRSNCGANGFSPWSTVSFATAYCTPTPTSVDGSGMTKVVFGTVSNTTTAEPGNYGDYTAMASSHGQGTTVNVGITYSTGYTYDTKIWIDFNNDWDFDDAGEEVYVGVSTNANPTTLNASFVIPIGTPLGNYRMRIGGVDVGPPTPCYAASYGTFEDYTLTVVPPPACDVPTSLAGVTTSTTSASLSWTASTSNPANGYQWEVRSSGAGGSGATGLAANGTTAAGVVTATASGLAANTTYTLYVRSDCGGSGFSPWTASSGTFYTGYCTVSGTTATYYISNFVTTGGSTNISNATPYVTGGYADYSAQAVSQYATGSVSFTTSFGGGSTQGFNIYIDWNNDLDFADAGETAYASGGYVSSASGAITVPAGTALGNHRMRITCDFLNTNPPACGSSTYKDTEDYTFTVVAPPSCVPPTGVTASGITNNGATVSWTASAIPPSGGYLYEVRTSGAAGSGATGLVSNGSTAAGVTTTTLSGLTSLTTYTVYVRGFCGGTDYSSWSLGGTFTTQALTPAPWVEGFATTSTPTGWTLANMSVGSSTGAGGNPGNTVYKNLYSGATTCSLTTINVGPVTSAMNFKFDYRLANFSSPYAPPAAGSGNFVVQISTDFGATYTTLETVVNNAVAGWQTKSYSLASYGGQIVKIKITGNWVSGDYYLAFDNFDISEPCTGTPVAGTVSPTSQSICNGLPALPLVDTGASNGGGITYQWEQSTNNGASWANAVGGTGATTLSFTPPNATGATIQYRLKATCPASGLFSYSNVSEVNSNANPLPLSQPFTDLNTLGGWNQTGGFGIGATRGATGNPGNNAYVNLYSSNINATFTTAKYGPVLAGHVLSFDLKLSNFSSPYAPPADGWGSIDVMVSTDCGQNFTSVGVINGTAPTGYVNYKYYLGAYTGQNIVVRLTGSWVAGDYDVSVDNIIINFSAPVISSFTPTSVCASEGGSIALTGFGFNGASSVTIGGNPVSSFTVNSDTSISVVTGANPTTGPIAVTTTYGTGTSSAPLTINPNPTVNPITLNTVDVTNGNVPLCGGDTADLNDTSFGGTWATSNGSVASVDSNGLVTALAAGTTTISYTLTENTGCATVRSTTVTVNMPVVITSQPIAQTVLTNSPSQFSVAATGSGLTYQWQVSTDGGTNFTDLTALDTAYSGINSTTLQIANTPAAFNGNLYQVVVSGVAPCALATSNPVALNVGDVGITTQPSNVSLCSTTSGAAVFTVATSGTVNTYEWYENQGFGPSLITDGTVGNLTYSGSTTNQLTVTGATLDESGYTYFVKAIGPANSAPSNVATLTVNEGATITGITASQAGCTSGGVSAFTVNTTGSVFGVQWQVASAVGGPYVNVANNSNFSYATSSNGGDYTLTITNNSGTPAGAYYYKAIVDASSPCDDLTSTPGVLTLVAPTVNITASAQTYCAGTAVTLTANGASSYVWSPVTGLFTNAAATTPYVANTPAATVYAAPGTSTTYTVTGTDANGCSATKTVTIGSGPAVSGIATADLTTVCPGAPVTLTANGASTFTPGSVGSYAFTNTVTPYQTIVGGTGTTAVTLSSVDDAISAPVAIPFPFNFGGTPFNDFKINSNGWINLGSASTSTTEYSALTTVNNSIAVFNRDLNGNNTTTNTYYVQTVGTSPNRITKIEWVNVKSFSGSANPATANFQLWLYETSNVVEMHYGAFTPKSGATANSIQVGLRGATSAAVNVRSLSNTGSWATPTVGTSSSSTVALGTFAAPILPDNGRTYRFTPGNAPTFTYSWTTAANPSTVISTASSFVANPTVPTTYNVAISSGTGCAGSASVAVNVISGATITTQPVGATTASTTVICQGSNASFTVAATGPGLTYQWYKGTPGSGTIVSGATANTYSITAALPAASGSYYVVVTPSCGAAATSDAIALTVNPTPTATAPSTQNFCEGTATSAITLTGTPSGVVFDITGGSAIGLANQSGVTSIPSFTPIFGSALITVTPRTVGTVTCPGTAVTFTINVKSVPSAVTITPSSATICANGSAALLTAGGGSYAFSYCTPAMTTVQASGDYIANFVFAGISNASGDTPTDYTYYSNLSANVTAGTAYPVTLTAGTGSVVQQQFRIWIDMNQDGVFTASESVFGTTTATTGPTNATGNITIPVTAYNGTTRMRVASRYNTVVGTGAFCVGESQYGEYEDYNIVISGGATKPTLAVFTPNGAGSGLYTNAAATTVYTGTAVASVYAKPSGTSATYTATVSNGTCTNSATATINVNPTPTATAPATQTVCSGVLTSPIAISGTPSGVTYDISGGSSIGLSDQTGVTQVPAFTATGTSAVISITPKANGCTGTAVTFTINVSPATVGGSVTGTGTATCQGSTSGLLTLSGNTGDVVRWESSVSPFTVWTPIANTNTTYTSGPLTQTTQFRAVVKSGSCSEVASAPATVTINSVTLSSISSPQVCVGAEATITMNGLVPNSTSTVTFTRAGIAQPTVTVVADASGLGSFQVMVTGASQNITVTSIQRTDATPNCTFTPTSGNSITLVSSAGCTTLAACPYNLATIDQQIIANIVSGAQAYRWRVTRYSDQGTTLSTEVQTLDTALRTMKLVQLAQYRFNTYYKVEVATLRSGVWGPYGPSCTAITPATTTTLTNCGTVASPAALTTLSDVIYANIVPYAAGYRFQIRDMVTNQIQTIDRSTREFRMNLLTDIKYNRNYEVSVAVRNTDGTYLPYNTVGCVVKTPVFPTTSVQDSQCEDFAAASNTTQIFANSYPGAIAYAFQLTGPNGPYVAGVEVVKTARVFTLSDFTGLIPGATYDVRVRLIFNYADPAGPYGKTCSVVVPGAARTVKPEFKAVAYPNPFADNFNIDVTTSAEDNVTVKVYDMTGRLLESHNVHVNEINSLEIGDRFPSGVYNVIVSQGEEVKTLRVVKR
ncbi:MAG: T9SS type A sorting domain-containing protein [Sphingobacteriales bacterium]|nr:MAG: T9SS type A sorting domain-containing protein [Sphingobacteriales bacterium]